MAIPEAILPATHKIVPRPEGEKRERGPRRDGPPREGRDAGREGAYRRRETPRA